MAQLSIANVISISVSDTPTGLGEYNPSNIAIFTPEAYESSFGADGYKIYLEPEEVADDFGSDSMVYKQALAIFSQRPNILANRGYLVVFSMIVEVQSATPDAAPVSGDYVLNFGGDATAAIPYNATAADIQTAVRTITGLEQATVTGTLATALTITMRGYYGPAALMTVTSNTMVDGGAAPVTLTIDQVTEGETAGEAVSRTKDIVQYFSAMFTTILSQVDLLALGAVIQALNKMAVCANNLEASIEVGGALDLLRTGSLTKTRGLYYGGTDEEALLFQAAYAGRGFSTVFAGSNTTQNMHLKTLATIQPDDSMTQTILNKAKAAGADTYVSIEGLPGIFSTGANKFFDQVYNLGWFVGDLQVRGFNYLRQASTKVPQTENGMQGLKGAYRKSCEAAVTNQYVAPGAWNSPTTFGNQQDLLDNITNFGYYIYSQPIALQAQAAREAREAPLIQIAVKEAGAIDSSAVIVNVNA